MLHTIEQRLTSLERRRPQSAREPLQKRIDRYVAIMDSEDYSGEEGRALKARIDKYRAALEEIEGFKDE